MKDDVKGIIELLGINPLKQYYNRILDLDIFSTHEIRELEKQRDCLLEAILIDLKHDLEYLHDNFGLLEDYETTLKSRMEKKWHNKGILVYDDLIRKIIAVKKACHPKSWEEIKGLLDD